MWWTVVAGNGFSGREFGMSEQERRTTQGADYENVGTEYLEQRQLQKGAAGWVLLAGLGVAYVISGDFAGWNFGLAEGGWGGLLIATLLMATMYTAMVFGLAELSSTIPTAGGGYGFARRAMGPWGGFMTGTAILIEYAIAPAAIATFIGGYVETLTGIGGGGVFLAARLIFLGHFLLLRGGAALLLFAVLVLLFGPGGAGSVAFTSDEMLAAPSVLPLALEEAYGGGNALVTFVNIVGLAGLIASFFSLIFAYSRQTFALSRAGYLPRLLSITSGRRTPWMALIVPGVIGLVLSTAGGSAGGVTLLNSAVFGATISYALMMLSHIVLRQREPDLDRPYRTPGGVATSGVALVLAVLAVIATFIVDVRAALITLGVYALFLAYFGLYSRHHLVAQAPEEEFATIEKAESELAGS